MGRKAAAKAVNNPPVPPEPPKRSLGTPIVAAIIVAAVVIGGVAYWRSAQPDADQNAAAPQVAPIPADLKPHPQEKLPPLQFPAYEMARPREVVSAAYKFAAEHPEVLSYVPCFCGCERQGHRGNEDCFVKARDINGDVIEWEDHGMECAVCLDVATHAMEMFNKGSSRAQIRAEIERAYSKSAHTHTPTPAPPTN